MVRESRPEDQKRIFKSLEQLGSNISRSQGTGLGLATSSNIVRMMGGELRVKSQLGKGSETATLRLRFHSVRGNQRKKKSRKDKYWKGSIF